MKTAAQRQALKRKRAELGLVECRAWVPADLVDWFIRVGAISEAEAEDPSELGNVIAIFAIVQATEARGFAFPSQRDWLARIIGV
jgi:hypothetical protein